MSEGDIIQGCTLITTNTFHEHVFAFSGPLTLTGNNLPSVYTSTSDAITVQFKSDSTTAHTGALFTVRYGSYACINIPVDVDISKFIPG